MGIVFPLKNGKNNVKKLSGSGKARNDFNFLRQVKKTVSRPFQSSGVQFKHADTLEFIRNNALGERQN